jgi:multidrug efflux pump subunit AcrB
MSTHEYTGPDGPDGVAVEGKSTGPIAWMARNQVAANLLMVVILVGGLLGISRVKQEVFPAFDLDMVRVTVPYPGASPDEVEQGIVLAIEEAIRGTDGVSRVTAAASEGSGTVAAELLAEANPDRVLADIKSAVDRIRSFPVDAESAEVRIVSRTQRVISLMIAGDQPLGSLHAIAEQARSTMLLQPGITQVEIEGVPPLEVAVSISRAKLQQYGLSLAQVADQIRAASLELPGGGIKTQSGEILVRLSDRRRSGSEFGQMVLRSTSSHATVRLADIATITDGHAESDEANFYNGQPALRVTAYRVGEQTPQSVADATRAALDVLRTQVPSNITLDLWDDDSEMLRGRIALLQRNAALGSFLVLLILALFLNLRLAFWVGLGIPISFMGTFLVMPALGLTINMVSLFALIIVLGMVVDDAIIVGEAGHSKMLQGMDPLRAAIAGAGEMAMPVSFAILTTIAAFGPLLFIPGLFGKIFGIIPMMVISVLIFSVIESFFILPAHLAASGAKSGGWTAPIDAVQERVNRALERFIRKRYRPAVERVIAWRYTTVATAVALLFLGVGTVASGLVPFSFFPAIDGDVITANVQFPYGTDIAHAERAGQALQKAADDTVEKFGGPSGLRGMFLKLGSSASGSSHSMNGGSKGSHVVSLEINLTSAEEREFSAEAFAAAWEQATPELLGARSLVFSSKVGPSAGAAVALQLSHHDSNVLERASTELATELGSFADLTSVENGFAGGKRQIDLRLNEGVALARGITAKAVASSLRTAFYGAEAVREQRDRNELRVMVRLPEHQRASEHDLEAMRVRTPSGGYVPLGQVAEWDYNRAPTRIDREEGRRVVAVTASLAAGVASSATVLKAIHGEVLPELIGKFPGLEVGSVGEQREQGAVFSSLGPNFLLALFVIFSLLAVPLKSYLQPLIIMSAIPFGIVGAIFGHLVMGYGLSFVSVLGIIALAGVVVNDSLVLVDTCNRYRRRGEGALDAIASAGVRRFRPILLTSLTTFFGLLPMIFESSVQARFLIPMAISLGFGVLFATAIILFLVPVFYVVVEDVLHLVGRLRRSEGTASGP